MSDEFRWGTAVHEAGHAVAAYVLGRSVTVVTIVAEDDTLGHVKYRRRGQHWLERLEEADYASKWGGFIDARTRRFVEIEVITSLAGGLAEMKATGQERHEVGMGLAKVSPAEAAQLAATLGDGAEFESIVVAGDYRDAFDLAESVSGSPEEAAAYFSWLHCRTENLLAEPTFWPALEAVARALCDKGTLKGETFRQVVQQGRESVLRRAF